MSENNSSLTSHFIGKAVFHSVKACTQTPKHVDTPVDTNSSDSTPNAARGPADPLQPQQLYILKFYDLDLIFSCHSAAWVGSAQVKGPPLILPATTPQAVDTDQVAPPPDVSKGGRISSL